MKLSRLYSRIFAVGYFSARRLPRCCSLLSHLNPCAGRPYRIGAANFAAARRLLTEWRRTLSYPEVVALALSLMPLTIRAALLDVLSRRVPARSVELALASRNALLALAV